MERNLKLTVYNTEYYVNEKKKRVRCKLEFGLKGHPDTLNMISTFRDEFPFYEVVGEANTDPQDVFDPEIGMKIARAKAETMAYRKVNALVKEIGKRMVGIVSDFLEFGDKTKAVQSHNDTYLKSF